MKKVVILFLALFCAGAVLMCLGVFTLGGLQSNDPDVEDSVTYPSDITEIRLKDTDATVMIRRTSGSEIEIDTRTPESRPFHYEHDGNSLGISRPALGRHWFHFDFFWHYDSTPYNIRISLPESFSGDLILETASGDILLDQLALTGDFTVRTASGDVSMTDVRLDGAVDIRTSSGSQHFLDTTVTGAIITSASSGDISLNNVDAVSCELSASSGNIRLAGTSIAGDIRLRTTSGDMRFTNVTAEGNLNVGTSSGGITLRDTNISGDITSTQTSGDLVVQTLKCSALTATTSSGEILLNDAETGNLELESSSGDVRLRRALLSGSASIRTTSGEVSCRFRNSESDVTTITKTNSGSCNRPGQLGSGGQIIRVTTSSGDIHLAFE